MRIFIDTNVLISAALNAHSTPYKAYIKATSYPNRGLICEQNIEELHKIFKKKFPHRLVSLNKFLTTALLTLELVPIPINLIYSEMKIRDINDRPILRAAVRAQATILLTGDKDFLESRVQYLAIMTPSEFLLLFENPLELNTIPLHQKLL